MHSGVNPVDAPPSWYPDPASPDFSYRWWDGAQWTDQTRTAQSLENEHVSGDAWQMPSAWSSQGHGAWGTTMPRPGSPSPANAQLKMSAPAPSFTHNNHRSLTAIGVAALYVLVALTSHVVLFGIVPAAAAVRAFKRREPLAPIAAVAAGTAILVAIAVISAR